MQAFPQNLGYIQIYPDISVGIFSPSNVRAKRNTLLESSPHAQGLRGKTDDHKMLLRAGCRCLQNVALSESLFRSPWLRPGGRPGAAGGVSPAAPLGLRVLVAAAVGVALRPGGRPGAAGRVSSAVTLGLHIPVAARVGVALRPGGRPSAAGGVSPAVTLGLRVPVTAAMGVALTDRAAVGAPHGAVAAGSSTAATVGLTGRRPRAVIPRPGTAAHSSVHTVPGVLTGASGAAAGLGRPPVTEFSTGRVGVVVIWGL